MQAYQTGGTPSSLANILSKDSTGEYYVLSCSFSDMTACISAASGMLTYAQNDFQKQFSLTSGTNLAPLGLGFTEYQPIMYVGITPPTSFVTSDVKTDRENLGKALKENLFYQNIIGQFVNSYPAEWELGSKIFDSVRDSYNQAKINVAALMSPGNSQQGAAGCWDTPNTCSTLASSIMGQVKPIDYKSLAWLTDV